MFLQLHQPDHFFQTALYCFSVPDVQLAHKDVDCLPRNTSVCKGEPDTIHAARSEEGVYCGAKLTDCSNVAKVWAVPQVAEGGWDTIPELAQVSWAGTDLAA